MATSRDVLASIAIRIGVDSANMSKSLNKIQSDMNVFKNGLKTLGRAIAGVFAVDQIIGFGKEAFAAYNQQYKAEQLLLTALKGRKDVQERLIRQAEYLQKTTLFEDDQIITQQKLLAATGKSEKQIRSIIGAATQLATALRVDLDQAVKMLTSSLAGNTRELGRLVPEVKAMDKAALAAGGAIEWVNKNMKDLAETAANTDPITQMKKAWDELKESFGSWVAPAVTGFSRTASKQFTIWGSDIFNFGQKLSTLWKSKEKFQGMYDLVLETEKLQQAQDDLAASTEEGVNPAFEKEVKLLKDVTGNLDDMAQAIEKVSGSKLSLPGFNNIDPISGKSAQVTASEGAATPAMSDLGLTSKWEENYQMITEYYDKIQERTYEFTQIIETMFEGIAVGFGEVIDEMISSGGKTKWQMLLYPIADAMGALGKMAIAEGIVIEGLKDALKSMNGYVAIAAGIALVAVASAIKSNLSSMANSMGGGGYAASPVSNSNTSNSFSRNFGEDYQKIDINLVLRNDHLAVATARGQSKMARY